MKKQLKELGIIAVYLFGSRASGRAGALSDYDIGVLLNKNTPVEKFLDAKLNLMQIFSDYFKTNNIDIVILNDAPSLLAMNIIEEGRVLFDFVREGRINFETKTTMKYLDRLPYEQRHLDSLITSV